jgi:hypothetical protein
MEFDYLVGSSSFAVEQAPEALSHSRSKYLSARFSSVVVTLAHSLIFPSMSDFKAVISSW